MAEMDDEDPSSVARFRAKMDEYGRLIVPKNERKLVGMVPGWYEVAMRSLKKD
jgi:hypothetical protein